MFNRLFDILSVDIRALELYSIIAKNTDELNDEDFYNIKDIMSYSILTKQGNTIPEELIINSTIVSLFIICDGTKSEYDENIFINAYNIIFSDISTIDSNSKFVSDILRYIYTAQSDWNIENIYNEYLKAMQQSYLENAKNKILIGLMYKNFLDVFIRRIYGAQYRESIKLLISKVIELKDIYEYVVQIGNEYTKV